MAVFVSGRRNFASPNKLRSSEVGSQDRRLCELMAVMPEIYGEGLVNKAGARASKEVESCSANFWSCQPWFTASAVGAGEVKGQLLTFATQCLSWNPHERATATAALGFMNSVVNPELSAA